MIALHYSKSVFVAVCVVLRFMLLIAQQHAGDASSRSRALHHPQNGSHSLNVSFAHEMEHGTIHATHADADAAAAHKYKAKVRALFHIS